MGKQTSQRTYSQRQLRVGEMVKQNLKLKLQKMYYEIVRGEHKQYYHWLTFVN